MSRYQLSRIVATLIVLASATAGSAEAQTAAEPGYRAPRTPDGQPDISGIWTNDTLTPLERPPELGDKAFYSAEEAEAIERRGTGARDRDNAPGRQRTAAGGSLDRGYNFFWFDPRDHIVPTRRTSMVAEPASGRVPTRPAAEERAAWLVANRSDSYLNMSPYSRCITRGVPGSMLPNSYNTGNHIFQVPGYVIIVYEMVRESRIIPLDGRLHVDPRIRQWMGDARGRWEGETLVVDTTHFTEEGLDHAEPERRPHARRPRQPGAEDRGALHPRRRARARLAGPRPRTPRSTPSRGPSSCPSSGT